MNEESKRKSNETYGSSTVYQQVVINDYAVTLRFRNRAWAFLLSTFVTMVRIRNKRRFGVNIVNIHLVQYRTVKANMF